MKLEKPLHVQVAEALGYGECSPCNVEDGTWHFSPGNGPAYREDFTPIWRDTFDYGERHRCDHDLNFVPSYDTDWGVTGPLIEKYGFWLRQLDTPEQPWDAFRNDDLTFPRGFGPTPLIAVCRLILALAEAGVLKAA